jgi:ElaB/YqjD/DUF883 family membrane-anchored ribosome-binding protein
MSNASRTSTATSPKQWEQPAKRSTGMGGAMENVAETAKEVVSAAGDAVGQAKDKVQEWSSTAASQVKNTTQELASATAEKAGDLANDLTQFIRRYPFYALIAGFGAGLLIGGMMARSSRA